MKIKIRKNCFETNSSSVHAICINKNLKKETINHIVLDAKTEFDGRCYSLTEKANYIFLMCLYSDMEVPVLYFQKEKSKVYKFVTYLREKGIKVKIKEYDEYYNNGLGDFEETLEILMSNEKLMDKFLFDDNSYFHIMDDNYVDENLPLKKDYDIFTFNE